MGINKKGAPTMEEFANKLGGRNTLEKLADLLKENKKNIFDTLKNNVAEERDDEQVLEKLVRLMGEKKVKLAADLGKGKNLTKQLPGAIDFSSDTALIDFWEEEVKKGRNQEVGANKRKDPNKTMRESLKLEVKEALIKIQSVDMSSTNGPLFGGKSDNLSNIPVMLGGKEIEAIIEEKDTTYLETNMKNFIKDRKEAADPFYMSPSSLYTKEQKHVAMRITTYLYCINQLLKADETRKELDKTDFDRFTKIIKEQIQDIEVKKLTGLYNVKKELERAEPLHEVLRDLNINLNQPITGTHDLEQNSETDMTVDLTGNFENGKAVDLDHYELDGISLGGQPLQMMDLGNNNSIQKIEAKKGENEKVVKLSMDDGSGTFIEVATLILDNKRENTAPADLKIKFNSLDNLRGLNLNLPLDLEMNLKGTKKVKYSARAALQRPLKYQLQVEDVIPPPPPVTTVKDWSATISNVEQVHKEEAEHYAEELTRAEYANLGNLSLLKAGTWKPWQRFKKLMFRETQKQKRVKADLLARKGNIDLTRDSVVNASDRHEKEAGDTTWEGFTGGEKINRKFINHTNSHIDLLCKQYLSTTLSDDDFEQEFNRILRNDTFVNTQMGRSNMDFLASNILVKLKQEKAEVQLHIDIEAAQNPYVDQSTFEAAVKAASATYFATTKLTYPDVIGELLRNSNDPVGIATLVNNWKAQLHLNYENLKMNLQLLDNTTGAYEINNKDKEKGARYKMGAWMDRHPWLTMGGSVALGTGVLAVGGVVGGVVGAAVSTAMLATKAAVFAGAKKSSHYTKEQKGQEKRLTHSLDGERSEMQKIKDIMNHAPKWSFKRYKAKRQYKLYQESTQQNIADTTFLTSAINTNLAIPGRLSQNEARALQNALSEGLVRLDYYKERGHNFVASQDAARIEQDMNELYQAIQQGAKRAGVGMDTIRSGNNYNTLKGHLYRDYNAAKKNFHNQRGKLIAKYGIGSGMLYAATAVGGQWLLGSGIFGDRITEIQAAVPGTSSQVLHDEVGEVLKNAGATPENIDNITKALQTAHSSAANAQGHNPQAFWTMVQSEMGRSEAQLNNWMHDFMKDTLWKLNENGTSEFAKALLDAKFDTIDPAGAWAKTAEAYLSSPRIGLIKQGEGAQVLQNIQDWLSGAKSESAFSSLEKMKMGYYGHLSVHGDVGASSRLAQEMTKLVSEQGTEAIEGVVNRHFFMDGVGLPVYANTFLQRMEAMDGTLLPIPTTPTPSGNQLGVVTNTNTTTNTNNYTTFYNTP